MSPPDATVGLNDLLAQRAWVRSLAVRLTRDEHDADDVEQQAWLAALRAPPRDASRARGWFGSVLRNAAFKRHRSHARRVQRETEFARRAAAATEDPGELAVRAELHALVAGAVVELDEPYRQAILLRYFEGLSVAQVAERMATPLETARARLRRGRAALRKRLDRDRGGGAPLVVVLAPLIGGRVAAPASSGLAAGGLAAGGVIMTGKWIAAGCAVALVAAGSWWALGPGGGDPDDVAQAPVPHSLAADVSVPDDPGVAPPVAALPDRERVRVAAADPSVSDETAEESVEPPAPAEPELTVEERLAKPVTLDLSGEKLGRLLGRLSAMTGVQVYVESAQAASLESVPVTLQLQDTDAASALRVVAMISGTQLEIGEDRVVLRGGGGGAPEADASLVLVEPVADDPNAPTTITVTGFVRDESGVTVAGATVDLGRGASVTSLDDGSYSLETPWRGQSIRAFVPYRERSRHWAAQGDFGITLEHDFVIGGPAGGVEVTVTSAGAALADAAVVISWERAGPPTLVRSRDGTTREVPRKGAAHGSTDAEGRFDDPCVGPGDVTVRVTMRGHAPEERTLSVRAGVTTSETIDLQPATLEGRLRMARVTCQFDDRPVHEALRYLSDTTRVPIVWAPGLAEESLSITVTLDIRDDTAEGALRAICDAAASIKFEIDEPQGLVWIKPRTR